MLRRGFILVIGGAAANAFQRTKSESADSQRRADIYAIYSRMMAVPKTSHGPGGNAIYLIRDKTVPGTPRVPCVSAPPPYQRNFAEVLADYDLRKDVTATLEYALNVATPYVLLNEADSAEFIETRRLRRGPRPDPPQQFRFSTDLFGLTDVYFNHDWTLALTGLSTWCGMLCGGYTWMVFEKTSAGWEELPWPRCRTIS